MNNTEEKLIKQTESILFRLVWICLGVDSLFFAYYMLTDDVGISPVLYFITRIILPLAVNLLCYFVCVVTDKLTLSVQTKHRICSACLCTVGGSIAVFHGYFVPLWCSPAIALVYCSVFRDKKQQNVLLVYSVVLIAAACAYTSAWHPESISEYIQNAVIVMLMTVIFSALSSVIDKNSSEIMEKRFSDYKEEQDRRKLMSFDSLTGVYSRTYAVSRIKNILSGESELGTNVDDMVLAAIDVDNFKSVNDTYGHENGDIVLRTLGEVLGSVIEKGGLAGRFGGEEFVLLFIKADYKKHLETLENLRETFMGKKYGFTKRDITFSGGAVRCRIGDDFDELMTKADEALYKAKNSGKEKNKIVESIEPGTVPVSNYKQDGIIKS